MATLIPLGAHISQASIARSTLKTKLLEIIRVAESSDANAVMLTRLRAILRLAEQSRLINSETAAFYAVQLELCAFV